MASNLVASSIRRVTDIVGEISAASSEQSAGVSQVGEAVTQLDHATQQNAALVEEMTAAAYSLKTQAQDLVAGVAVFKISAEHSSPRPTLCSPSTETRLEHDSLSDGGKKRDFAGAAPHTPCVDLF